MPQRFSEMIIWLKAHLRRKWDERASDHLAPGGRSPRTQQLFETSERFNTLIVNSPLAVIEWNPEYRITKWMGNSEQLFGWTAGEVLGKRLDGFGFIYPDDQKLVWSAIKKLEEGT